MKKTLLILLLGLMLCANSFAAEIITVRVNGMVCDFCARGLEKTFTKQESIDSIDVNLTEKVLTITLKEGAALDNEIIEKLVANAGYKIEEIIRN